MVADGRQYARNYYAAATLRSQHQATSWTCLKKGDETMAKTTEPTPAEPAPKGPTQSAAGTPPSAPAEPRRAGVLGIIEDQLGLGQLIREYMIPVETNTIWYILGGVLAIALVLEIATGMALSLVYTPDAAQAYATTARLLRTPGWSIVLNFHYYNAFLIFALVMVHMVRVFISGGYRRGKQGLWLIGVGLAGLTFLVSLTGETLHWDEVGFAVPWHISEFLQATGLAAFFQYNFADLKNIPMATTKLQQLYAVHIAIVPIVLALFIVMHYYLIKVKGISLPFWHRASGRTAAFSEHIKAWLIYGGFVMGAVLLLSIFVQREAGIAPQLLPSSPFFGSPHGPGALGSKPSFPISWTHGMNVFFGEHLGIEPDIWGTTVGITLMTLSLIAIPFLDRGKREPSDTTEAFDWRRRGWAFGAMGLFWLIMIVGIIQNAVAGAG
jgi:quinol-cytochrome oxidoreductase complex cytochrome b subunit